jgi:putative membrane protein
VSGPQLLAPAVVAAAALCYGLAATRLRRRGDRWPAGRIFAAAGGLGCLAAAVAPPVTAHDDVFVVHAVQHVLLAMLAPALLALSAPVTIALRTLPAGPRRLLLRAVHSRAARPLAWPPLVLILNVGGAYVLYLTHLYALTERRPLPHAVVHVHMVAAGCLLAWSVAGIDPVAHRPGLRVRLTTLVTAGAAHNILAKIMYAHALPAGAGTLADRQAGAQVLYYGGDVTDVVLAVALMAQWYSRTGRRSALSTATRPAGHSRGS